MCLKQNAIDFGSQYPKAAQEVETLFYVDDYLGGANLQQEAIQLQGEMHTPLLKGGFLLRKWSYSDPHVLESIPTDLRDSEASVILSHSDQYTKTLGIEWNALCDHFCVHVTELPPIESMTEITRFRCREDIRCFGVVFTHDSESKDPCGKALD